MPAPQRGIFPVPGCLTLCGQTCPLPPPRDCSLGSMCAAPLSASTQQQSPCKCRETARSCAEGDTDRGQDTWDAQTPGDHKRHDVGDRQHQPSGASGGGKVQDLALSHLHLRLLASRAGRGQHRVAFRPSPLSMAFCDMNTPRVLNASIHQRSRDVT